MKELWVKINQWDKDLALIAIESGANFMIVDEAHVSEVKTLGRINVVSKTEDADLVLGRDVIYKEIKGPEDIEQAITISKRNPVIVKTTDWHVIPLENLVANSDNILVEIKYLKEAEVAVGVLEKGVKGIVIDCMDPNELKRIAGSLFKTSPKLELTTFVVESILPLGMGDRVCVDTCSIFQQGEGLLVGNTSKALFLIHSETVLNPYADPRPFRVNAGAVHSYVMAPNNKTMYLWEVHSGAQVLAVSYDGTTRPTIVGRSKIERRPLLKVDAKWGEESISVILQNAETIRLVDPSGLPKSITQLKEGDQVLGLLQGSGRHFGKKIEEWIQER